MKHLLRQKAKQRRKTLNTSQLSLKILSEIEKWTLFKKAPNVLTYSPIHTEINLNVLISKYPKKQWYLPRVTGEKSMQFLQYKTNDVLTQSDLGIQEPQNSQPILNLTSTDLSQSIIFVPGLTFDQEGYRLGYGKGYYDYFFNQINSKQRPIIVGVVASALITEALPRDSWEIQMDFLATENGIIKTSNASIS